MKCNPTITINNVYFVRVCGVGLCSPHNTKLHLLGGYLMEQNRACPTNLADSIAYQEGSVVSKTIIKKDSGTITLFAFGKGQDLSEHTAPFDALVHILDGEAQIIISGKSFILQEGQIIILPANEPHALKAVKKFKMLLTMIKS